MTKLEEFLKENRIQYQIEGVRPAYRIFIPEWSLRILILDDHYHGVTLPTARISDGRVYKKPTPTIPIASAPKDNNSIGDMPFQEP